MKKPQQEKAGSSDARLNVENVLDCVSEKRKISRQFRKSYSTRQSKLECHRHIIIALHKRGASLQDIVVALRSVLKPKVDCVPSTVKRFIDADTPDQQVKIPVAPQNKHE